MLSSLYHLIRQKMEIHIDWPQPYPSIEQRVRLLEESCWGSRNLSIIDCFGDSHVSIFRLMNSHPAIRGRKIRFRCIPVSGATALGLANPNSKTNAFEIFRHWLVQIPANRFIFFMMGEVDAGFVIWWRAQKHQLPISQMLEESVNNYFEFILNVHRSHPKLYVFSAPLPTLADGNNYGPKVRNYRKEVTANQKQRTELTLNFNKKIGVRLKNKGIDFIDLDSLSLDSKTGLVHKELVNSRAQDHHYEPAAFQKMILNAFERELDLIRDFSSD